MSYTLGTAARATGLSKATVHRAIKSGRISATKLDDGSYRIEPAEMHRVFPPVSAEPPETGVSDEAVRQSATPSERPRQPPETPSSTSELAIVNSRLEAEIIGLKAILQVHRDQVGDLRQERDRLLGQVEAVHRLLTHQPVREVPERASWFRRLLAG